MLLLEVTRAAHNNPMMKVLEMISDLQKKMIAESEESLALYNANVDWCRRRSVEMNMELKSDKSENEDLTAGRTEEKAKIESMDMKVEEGAQELSAEEADLKQVKQEFKMEGLIAKEQEEHLMDMIKMLDQAHQTLEREKDKGGASMLELKSASSLTQALSIMVQASLCSSEDAQAVATLARAANDAESADMDVEVSPPEASAYMSNSGGIVQTLSDLKDKAQKQLDEVRAGLIRQKSEFDVQQTTLQNAMAYSEADVQKSKRQKGKSEEEASIIAGDLALVQEELREDIRSLKDLHLFCMGKAQDFSRMQKCHDDEIKVLEQAKAILQEQSGTAAKKVYDEEDEEDSFFQVSLGSQKMSSKTRDTALASTADLVLHRVRKIARKSDSHEVSLLASQITTVLRSSARTGKDPFAQVVGMISGMLSKLEEEASDDATQDQYCRKELSSAKDKGNDRSDTVERLSTKIDRMSARSNKLKEKVAGIQKTLAEFASSQTKMEKLRKEEHAKFLKEKVDLEQGLEGVRTALKVLQEYTGKTDEKKKLLGNQIITTMETIESDFSKSMASLVTAEEAAAKGYISETQENEQIKSMKESEVKLKVRQFTALDKSIAESKSDRAGVKNELDAVNEYMEKLNSECSGKSDSFEKGQKKRQETIAGLKEALGDIEGDASFLQRSTRHTLRGTNLRT